jgi:membrane-bound acyltransferase YfiQ involved in biofilm formation
MLQETGNTSQSSDKPKRKKKFLYLEKFETYQGFMDKRLEKIESAQFRLSFITVIVGLGIAGTALMYAILNS